MYKTVPEKANLILNLILAALLVIVGRVWYLSIVQHEAKVEESRRPQKKTILLPAERGTIRDRYNHLLATNRLKYRAAVVYSEIQEVPSALFEKQPDGSLKKIFKRKEYIEKFSELLSQELGLEKERLEDLIHSKACLLGGAPLVIKEDLSEQHYFRLKALEKDWPGLRTEIINKRYYPLGPVGCDVIGYMGAINRSEYRKVMEEIAGFVTALELHREDENALLPEGLNSWSEVERKLKSLQDKAYTINDRIGKSGIESSFDQALKGRIGKQLLLLDRKGTLLRPLPGSKAPIPGERIHLCLSIELQQFAEELLIDNEERRTGRSFHFDSKTLGFERLEEPWIKGGAIVVMDPNNGEILALASYPRFDPNDFVPTQDPHLQAMKRQKVSRWLENEEHIASLWNQKEPLKRERLCKTEVIEEEALLTWSLFLHRALPKNDPVLAELEKFGTVKHALILQRTVYTICRLLGLSEKEVLEHFETLDISSSSKAALRGYFGHLEELSDRLLFADMMRLLIREELFSEETAQEFGSLTLEEYKHLSALYKQGEELLRRKLKTAFRHTLFAEWRKTHQSDFLKEKRAEEKRLSLNAKPWLDYIEAEEVRAFAEFWEKNRWTILRKLLRSDEEDNPLYTTFEPLFNQLSPYSEDQIIRLFMTMRSFEEMDAVLWGNYPFLRKFAGLCNQKSLASSFYPITGFGYGRSFAFRQASQIGSLFKLVPAYAALLQRYQTLTIETGRDSFSIEEMNPLTIIDSYQKTASSYTMGSFLDGKPIPRLYKGGRLPRSERVNNGRVNLIGALETSSNPYFSLLSLEHLESPEKLTEAASSFSFGQKTGIDLTGEISGKLPSDLSTNPTGLYSFAIGQHAFDSTPLQGAVMLSTLANEGSVLKPQMLKIKAGKQPALSPEKLFERETFPFQKSLEAIGIDFPLLTASLSPETESLIDCPNTQTKRKIAMPSCIRKTLLEGMKQVVVGPRGTGKANRVSTWASNSRVMDDYRSSRFVCKTSTAQRMERLWPAKNKGGSFMANHIWCGNIFFDSQDNPELVVIVYLRYGDFGREAVPLATQVAKKWEEIKKAEGNS